MTTLENSYCVPRTVEEWRELGADKSWEFREGSVVYTSNPVSAKVDFVKHFSNEVLAGPIMRNRTEISAPRLLDLMHDRIVPWRLVEAGFSSCATPEMMMMSTGHGILCASDEGVWFNHMRVKFNITTFTDLLKLISFLKPESR